MSQVNVNYKMVFLVLQYLFLNPQQPIVWPQRDQEKRSKPMNMPPSSRGANDRSALKIAEDHLESGRLDQAAMGFRALLAQDPHHFESLMGLGVICAQRSDFQKALLWLTQAVDRCPTSSLAHYNLGIVLKSLNRPQDAVRSFTQAIDHDPQNMAAINALGNSLAACGRSQDALRQFELAQGIQPDHPQTLYNRGLVLQSMGALDAAFRSYEQAVSLDPSLAAAWTNMGTILQDHGDDDDAELCFRQALAARPDCVDALVNLGLLLFRRSRPDEAAAMALAAGRLKQASDFPHYSLGLLFAKLGRVQDAHLHLSQSLQADPTDSCGARLVLAGLGVETPPDHPSHAHLQKLYEARAAVWDGKAQSARPYLGHELVADLFLKLYAGRSDLSVLDAGCGTGLVGQCLLRSGKLSRLDGVDLSAPMLERAKEKGLYHGLHHQDLVAFMAEHPDTYDAVTSAATLIHFGNLQPVFEAARTALRPDGRFLFTLFPAPDDQATGAMISLLHGHAEGGCYLHPPKQLALWAVAAGFYVETTAEAVHEYDRDRPVIALTVSLRATMRRR